MSVLPRLCSSCPADVILLFVVDLSAVLYFHFCIVSVVCTIANDSSPEKINLWVAQFRGCTEGGRHSEGRHVYEKSKRDVWCSMHNTNSPPKLSLSLSQRQPFGLPTIHPIPPTLTLRRQVDVKPEPERRLSASRRCGPGSMFRNSVVIFFIPQRRSFGATVLRAERERLVAVTSLPQVALVPREAQLRRSFFSGE